MTSFSDLHLAPAIASTLERLGWSADDPALRETAPTAARGHNIVVAAPPSPAYAVPVLAGMLSRLGQGSRALVLCADAHLAEWGGVVNALGTGLRIQVARGTARATRRLKAAEVDVLVTSPDTALTLHRHSALAPDLADAVVLAWPESWESSASLTPLMQDVSKDAQRIVCTSSVGQAADLIERYARRALTTGAPSVGSVAAPLGPVRTVAVPWDRRAAALTDLVEIMDPASVAVWTVDRSRHAEIARALPAGDPGVAIVTGDSPKAAAVIAFDLPTSDRLGQLLEAGEVVLLVPPGTEQYVERLAAPRRAVRLPGTIEAVTSQASERRAAIVRRIEEQRPDAAVLTLAPLFERYDPSAVAAALYDLWTSSPAPPPAPEAGGTAKIFVGIGKKDGVTVNDLVAVLTKEIRVEGSTIGRVELRDAFSLVELPAGDAERVAAALNGTTIRRKRVAARVDRGSAKAPVRSRPPRTSRRP